MRKLMFLLIWVAGLPAVAHVGLDAPVGGEHFMPGDNVVIKWHVQIQHPQENWDLYFSQDGGLTWQELGLNLPVSQTSFNWTVPDVNTTVGKIRIVMDNSGPDYEAVSGNFSIGNTMPFVLEYPMGGEMFAGGDTEQIKWRADAGTAIDYWSLYYSNDGGKSWMTIAEKIAADQRMYDWLVPFVNSSDVYVRLVLQDGASAYEAISKGFTIESAITGLADKAESKTNWQLYPNPAHDQVFISGVQGPYQIKLLSPQGHLLDRQADTAVPGQPLDVSHLSPGLYLVQIVQGQKQMIGRLLIQ